jgi:hypothetical protein
MKNDLDFILRLLEGIDRKVTTTTRGGARR